MRTHRNLIKYALQENCRVTVEYCGQLDLIRSNDYVEIKEAVEACDEISIHIFDSSGTYRGTAYYVNDGSKDTIADHSDNDWFNTWWNQV